MGRLPRQHELPVATVLVTTGLVSFGKWVGTMSDERWKKDYDFLRRSAIRVLSSSLRTERVPLNALCELEKAVYVDGAGEHNDDRVISKQLLIDARSVINDGREYERDEDIAERARVLAELGSAIDGE